jgi:carbamoyltransferase
MYILGISAFYHDSAACLVKDGEIVAAAQEERFTRIKHDFSFPLNSINYCLKEARLSSRELDLIAFYDKPFLKFERILESYLAYAPYGINSFYKAIPLWLKQKLFLRDIIKRELNYRGKILFPEHHLSHAAAAFFPSPLKEAAILTLDGVGEWTTTGFGVGQDNHIRILSEIKFPHSLGLLYSAFTYFTGFKVNSDEYKVMGLAPYGEPRYVERILNELIDLKEDGSFKLNMRYFDYCAGLAMTNRRFNRLFDGPPRKPESQITQREMDLARSVQVVTEEAILRAARYVHRITGKRYLCMSGGVALNCVANGRLLREGPFQDIWIQPAASDAGSALGAALFAWYQYLNNSRLPRGDNHDFQRASLLGPAFDQSEIEEFLKKERVDYQRYDEDALIERVAQLITEGKVIGWFQGRMEYGPRALGARSIIADARLPQMQSILNLKIKFRESFRPFAPSVLKDRASDYFELDRESPYMLLVAPVSEKRRNRLSPEEEALRGLDKLKVVRSQIPAVTHVDYSARIQTVKEEDNPLYYRLIKRFFEITGCPLIINTSFNVRGEPIVCTPKEALRCFLRTQMDYLVLGPFLIDKKALDVQRLKHYVDNPPKRRWPALALDKDTLSSKELKNFGFILSVVLACVGLLLFRKTGDFPLIFLISALASLGASVLRPVFLLPFWKILSILGQAIGWVVTKIVLAVIFYMVFTPIGIFLRLRGRDLLDEAIDKSAATYWRQRKEEISLKESCESQF